MSLNFERLTVWQRSLDFADAMFELADNLPKRHQFSLGEKVRRAAPPIPTNIAEGCGRDGLKERAYFYSVAKGSVYEVISLLAMVGKRGHLGHADYQHYHQEADKLAAMLRRLVKSTR